MGKFTNLVLIAAATGLIVVGVAAQTGTISPGTSRGHHGAAVGEVSGASAAQAPSPDASPSPTPQSTPPPQPPPMVVTQSGGDGHGHGGGNGDGGDD